MKRETEENTESVEVSFGDVFEHSFEDNTRELVIIDVTEDNDCSAFAILARQDSLIIHPIASTTHFSDVHKLTGETLTLDQIIEGLNNYYQGEIQVSEAQIQILTQQSVKPPVLLTK